MIAAMTHGLITNTLPSEAKMHSKKAMGKNVHTLLSNKYYPTL